MTKPLIYIPSLKIKELKAGIGEKDSQYRSALAKKILKQPTFRQDLQL